jgi:hypothetical protein
MELTRRSQRVVATVWANVSDGVLQSSVKPERLREWRRQLGPELAPAPRSEAE